MGIKSCRQYHTYSRHTPWLQPFCLPLFLARIIWTEPDPRSSFVTRPLSAPPCLTNIIRGRFCVRTISPIALYEKQTLASLYRGSGRAILCQSISSRLRDLSVVAECVKDVRMWLHNNCKIMQCVHYETDRVNESTRLLPTWQRVGMPM